jgi:Flp pilus assembly protein TadG
MTPLPTRPGSRDLRSEDGQTVLEFALVLPLLLVLVIGVANVAAAFNWWNDLNQIAGEGSRMAAVDKKTVTVNGTSYDLCNGLKQQGDTTTLKNRMIVTVSYPDGGARTAGSAVKVEAKADFTWGNYLPNFIGHALTPTLTGTAVMRLEQNSTLSTLSC